LALLEVGDIEVRFGGVVALAGLDMAVQSHQICALIGPNGAGKTTLFNVVSRLYEPTRGRVHFDGADLLAVRPHGIASRGIARTFQNLALVQAKLTGFIGGAQAVMQKYPSSDQSMPARYARAIAMFRRGDIKNALPIIDSLTKELPEDPYFWELKAQALLENGRAAEAVAPVHKALELLPGNGLIQILGAQAYIDTATPENAKQAIKLLRQAQRTEGETTETYRLLARAYALTGDVPRAELATAEAALQMGDMKLAMEKARSAQAAFKKGTPEWTRASDVMSFAGR